MFSIARRNALGETVLSLHCVKTWIDGDDKFLRAATAERLKVKLEWKHLMSTMWLMPDKWEYPCGRDLAHGHPSRRLTRSLPKNNWFWACCANGVNIRTWFPLTNGFFRCQPPVTPWRTVYQIEAKRTGKPRPRIPWKGFSGKPLIYVVGSTAKTPGRK